MLMRSLTHCWGKVCSVHVACLTCRGKTVGWCGMARRGIPPAGQSPLLQLVVPWEERCALLPQPAEEAGMMLLWVMMMAGRKCCSAGGPELCCGQGLCSKADGWKLEAWLQLQLEWSGLSGSSHVRPVTCHQ